MFIKNELDTEYEDNRKVAVYTRVSQQKQLEGYSLEMQKNEILKYINFYEFADIEDILIYEDGAKSAETLNRPGMEQLIKEVKNDNIKMIFVYKQDRISRDVSDINTIQKLLKKYNVQLKGVGEDINTKTAYDRYVNNIKASSAQLERELAVERTNAGLVEMVRQGKYPYGGVRVFGWDRVNKYMVINDTEAIIVKKIFNFASASFSPKEISEEMKFLGYNFDAQRIIRMIKDVKYKGIFIYKNVTYTNIVPAIISEKLFKDAQSINKKIQEDRDETKFYFNRKVYCTCGNQLVNTSAKKNGKRYLYYFCHDCCHGINQDYITDQAIERIIIRSNKQNKDNTITNLRKELKALDKKIELFRQRFINDAMSEKRFYQLFLDADKKRKTILARLNSLDKEKQLYFDNMNQIEKYYFIRDHVKKIYVDVETRLVISIEHLTITIE